MGKLTVKKGFTMQPYPSGWVQTQDGLFHKIQVTNKGFYWDGILLAKGKLRLVKNNVKSS